MSTRNYRSDIQRKRRLNRRQYRRELEKTIKSEADKTAPQAEKKS